MSYIVEQRLPDVSEYLELRKQAGWPLFDENVVRAGLQRSLFGVCITHENQTVGMGRILGDGAIYFHIQDVIVSPAHQRSGVGKMIMEALMVFVNAHAGSNANIGLMCSKGREPFYEEFGFISRPNANFGAGMIQIRP